MVLSYLLRSIRGVRKNPIISLVNVLGLSLGITCSLLIYLFVNDELSFDNFHAKAENIYRLNGIMLDGEGAVEWSAVRLQPPVGPAMKAEFSQVKDFTRFINRSYYVRRGNHLNEEDILIADGSLFTTFNFDLLQGNASEVFNDHHAVVITESIAIKYFGNKEAIGETLEIQFGGRYQSFKVTGVAKEVPGNSSIQFEMVLPFPLFETNAAQSLGGAARLWYMNAIPTYLELYPGADVSNFRAQGAAFFEKYKGAELEHMRKDGELEANHNPFSYELQPLRSIHLDTSRTRGLIPPSDPVYSRILAAIAGLILFIACINFMNLSIARAQKRAKEIGLRKVIGASRKQLIVQLIGESLLMAILALGLALLFADVSLPVFNQITNKQILFSTLLQPTSIIILATITIVSGLLAGTYPALFFSSFNPVSIFNGNIKFGSTHWFTRALIVLQFTFSLALIVGSLIMSEQLKWLKNKDLGFNQEQLLIVKNVSSSNDRLSQWLSTTFSKDTRVLSTTASNGPIAGRFYNNSFSYGDLVNPNADFARIDYDYFETLGIDIVSGRNFDPSLATDSTESIIVNEAFVREFIDGDDALGETITGVDGIGLNNPQIIGVTSDFHVKSTKYAVEPTFFVLNDKYRLRYQYVRLAPGSTAEFIASLEQMWKDIAADKPFDFQFADQAMMRQYESQERWRSIIIYSTFIAIFIACMGLAGLVSLAAGGRAKEVSIRKVLGAPSLRIFILLTREFTMLLALAMLISFPVAYFSLEYWLQGFANRIEISWSIFVVASALMLAAALLSVTYSTIKTIVVNPANTLRGD